MEKSQPQELSANTKDVINVTLAKNGNFKDTRVALIKRSEGLAGLLTIAKNKFKFKASRAFTETGRELKDEDLASLAEGTKIVVSDAKDFIGYKVEKKVKADSDVIVGGLSGDNSEALNKLNLLANDSKSPEQQNTNALGGNSNVGKVILVRKASYIEPDAIAQLEATSQLLNMVYAVGLPDLHPGKGFPIGVAAASYDVFYPHLVGNDIGCGMALYQTSIKNRKLKLDQWAARLDGLETAWEGDSVNWLKSHGVENSEFDATSLGTIGAGNHFAELQQIEEVVDIERFNELGMSQDRLYLLIHSGSRGFGESVLDKHLEEHGIKGLRGDSPEAQKYLRLHDWALQWAKCNRSLIAHRFLECLTGKRVRNPRGPSNSNNISQNEVKSTENTNVIDEDSDKDESEPILPRPQSGDSDVTSDGSVRVLDVWHNCVLQKEFLKADSAAEKQKLWLHRKGAAPSDCGPVVIPGSRGHFSYLVEPIPEAEIQQRSGYSLAHGAGRRWNRSKAFAAGEKQSKESLVTTKLGSRVICEKKDLLVEEAPDAYKEITDIISDLEEFGLIKVIAVFRPLITYKTRVKVYEKVDHRK